MVGSCGRSAGVLLPVGCRSSSGSIAGLALTYQSPDSCRDKMAVVKQAGYTIQLFRTTAPAYNVQCDEVDGVRYAVAGLALAASKTSPGRRVSKAFPYGEAFPYGNSR